MSMTQKKHFIWQIASLLYAINDTMTAQDLAIALNRNGILTSYGTQYAGGRGTYKLVSATWQWLYGQGLTSEAEKIAEVFTKPDGTLAWVK